MQDPFDLTAGWLEEHLLIPILYQLGLMSWEDVAYNWALFALYGVAQVVLTLAICWPLERWRPVERWPNQDAVGTDIVYTLLNRIGVLPLVTYVLFYRMQVSLTGWMTDHDWVPPTLEGLFPRLLSHPVLTFVLYAVILDFADFVRHYLAHQFRWWYALHSLHHAQRQMTFWSDDRNHVLDDVNAFVWLTIVSLAIGVPPMQFPLLVLLLRFLESLSHANVRLSFGWLGERLLISPRFHRLHHGIRGAGRQSCNYGAVLPWWDMLFGTADFAGEYLKTGDPSAEETMHSGTWAQQQLAGLRRLGRALGVGRIARRA
jgi:sterol desaturase/sphingolipid hydroxylase (fatty acid hydroxylase superfamily)